MSLEREFLIAKILKEAEKIKVEIDINGVNLGVLYLLLREATQDKTIKEEVRLGFEELLKQVEPVVFDIFPTSFLDNCQLKESENESRPSDSTP